MDQLAVSLSTMGILRTGFQEPLNRQGVQYDEETRFCSSTPEVHRGYINSSLLESDSKIIQCFEKLTRIDQNLCYLSHLREPNDHCSLSEATENMTINIDTSDQTLVTSKPSTCMVKQLPEDADANGNQLDQSSKRSRSKSKCTCKHRSAFHDREPSRLPSKKILKQFKKSKASRKYIKSYILLYG